MNTTRETTEDGLGTCQPTLNRVDDAGTSAAKSPHILHLPPSIRCRIYLYVNIAPRNNDGNLLWIDLDGPRIVGAYNRECLNHFRGLLLSCRVLYDKASSSLYPSNMFMIMCLNKLSLTPMRSILPNSLSKITHLRVILNATSCTATMAECPQASWSSRLSMTSTAMTPRQPCMFCSHCIFCHC